MDLKHTLNYGYLSLLDDLHLQGDSVQNSVIHERGYEVFLAFDRVFIAPKRITSTYNSCFHAVWTPTILPEDVPVESSSEEQLEEDDESEFWRTPPTTTHRFTCLHVFHLERHEEDI